MTSDITVLCPTLVLSNRPHNCFMEKLFSLWQYLCWTKYDCQKSSVVLKQRRQCPAPIPGEEGHCLDEGRTGFHRAHGWKKLIFVSPRTIVCPTAEKCMNIDKSMLICGNEAERVLWGSLTLCSGFTQGGILFVWAIDTVAPIVRDWAAGFGWNSLNSQSQFTERSAMWTWQNYTTYILSFASADTLARSKSIFFVEEYLDQKSDWTHSPLKQM